MRAEDNRDRRSFAKTESCSCWLVHHPQLVSCKISFVSSTHLTGSLGRSLDKVAELNRLGLDMVKFLGLRLLKAPDLVA